MKIPEEKKKVEKVKRRLETREKWFMRNPYKLGSIFAHYIEKNAIIYGVNVIDNNGNFVCTVEIGARELISIDEKKVKTYMLDMVKEALNDESKRSKELEGFWKEAS